MKTPNPANEPDDNLVKSAPKKTLSPRVVITEPDLSKTVRAAFDLAKSAGQELDLDFNPPSDSGTAYPPLFRVNG